MSREEVGNLIAEAIPQFFSLLPGVGAIFKSYELGRTLMKVHDAVRQEGHTAELDERINQAEEYVARYLEALCGWCTTAIAVQNGGNTAMKHLYGSTTSHVNGAIDQPDHSKRGPRERGDMRDSLE